jgi:hypothetical protein
VIARLQEHAEDPNSERAYRAAKPKAELAPSNAAGEPNRFSQRRMAATVLTNTVYPVYAKGGCIRHNTPGRWWDSLYTWDSGFVGLGLAQLDIGRALDCLNAYLTEPGDDQTAFIHHGSPVPVQFYLFQEIWNRTQSDQILAHCYPRLRQYYRFMVGKLNGSTTATLASGLLKTWDYFYNSGGWDDYPPQVTVHREGLEPTVAPAITTSHVIRCAKIMRMAALALGDEGDVAEYQADVGRLASALQDHAWDDEAGYFGYVAHDAEGNPIELLRHESGANHNMGMDGCSPLVAGICNVEQRGRIVEHLMSPDAMWTEVGISTVDQSAPYYRVDGYWNGAVWMPHQWFFWKALLSLGDLAHAGRIARTALETWRREVGATYNCFEHFAIESGRGAGWHHFGGLSCPVLCWFRAYHVPGTLTVGLDARVVAEAWSGDQRSLRVDLELHGGDHQSGIIAVMAPGRRYAARWNDSPVEIAEMDDGVVQLLLPGSGAATLEIVEKE